MPPRPSLLSAACRRLLTVWATQYGCTAVPQSQQGFSSSVTKALRLPARQTLGTQSMARQCMQVSAVLSVTAGASAQEVSDSQSQQPTKASSQQQTPLQQASALSPQQQALPWEQHLIVRHFGDAQQEQQLRALIDAAADTAASSAERTAALQRMAAACRADVLLALRPRLLRLRGLQPALDVAAHRAESPLQANKAASSPSRHQPGPHSQPTVDANEADSREQRAGAGLESTASAEEVAAWAVIEAAADVSAAAPTAAAAWQRSLVAAVNLPSTLAHLGLVLGASEDAAELVHIVGAVDGWAQLEPNAARHLVLGRAVANLANVLQRSLIGDLKGTAAACVELATRSMQALVTAAKGGWVASGVDQNADPNALYFTYAMGAVAFLPTLHRDIQNAVWLQLLAGSGSAVPLGQSGSRASAPAVLTLQQVAEGKSSHHSSALTHGYLEGLQQAALHALRQLAHAPPLVVRHADSAEHHRLQKQLGPRASAAACVDVIFAGAVPPLLQLTTPDKPSNARRQALQALRGVSQLGPAAAERIMRTPVRHADNITPQAWAQWWHDVQSSMVLQQ